MRIEDVRFDCKYFKGDMPCQPNKLYDAECTECAYYESSKHSPESILLKKLRKEIIPSPEYQTKILFIKLGAIGDVIRTTPLVNKYNDIYQDCHFTWITETPIVLPKEDIDRIYEWNSGTLDIIIGEEFDIAINLDKEQKACELLKNIKAKEKFGFTWKDNHIDIATEKAENKLITGLFDHLSKKNSKSYMQEIFEICHLTFNKEEYMINLNVEMSDHWHIKLNQLAKGRTIIALNTGCGERWKTRLWPFEYWVKLIKELDDMGYFCLIMGGEAEHKRNLLFASQTNANYLGTFSLEEFIAITNNTSIIVTPVSMMMHVALALKKQLMLFHNIFNVNEFDLYGRGKIIEPISGCDCYFGDSCVREKSCMYDISVKDVLRNIAILDKNLIR